MSSKTKRAAVPAKKGKAPAKAPTQSAATCSKPANDQPPILEGIKCQLKKMADVLIDDKSEEISKSKRWPLLIDLNGAAVTFLKYRDTNYLCAMDSRDMEPETLRRALIGAIRFGKPLVIDLLDTETYEQFENAITAISTDLLQDLLSKDLLDNENYLKLVKDEDGELYTPMHHHEFRPDDFKLIIATTRDPPAEKLLRIFFPVTVQ